MLEVMSPEEVPRAIGPTIINAIISASLLTIVFYAWSRKYYHALMLTGTICIVVVMLFVLMKTLKQIDPDELRPPDTPNKTGTQRKRRSQSPKHPRTKSQATPATPTPLPSATPTPEQAPLPTRPPSTPQPSEKPTPLPAQGVITTPPPASPAPAVPPGRRERKFEEKDN